MENKKILEDFIKSQNLFAKEEDKIKMVVSEDEIIVDFGGYIFKQLNRSGITDVDYKRIWDKILAEMLFEFKKAKTNGK